MQAIVTGVNQKVQKSYIIFLQSAELTVQTNTFLNSLQLMERTHLFDFMICMIINIFELVAHELSIEIMLLL